MSETEKQLADQAESHCRRAKAMSRPTVEMFEVEASALILRIDDMRRQRDELMQVVRDLIDTFRDPAFMGPVHTVGSPQDRKRWAISQADAAIRNAT